MEFKDADAIANALLLNETEFKGRPLKVCFVVIEVLPYLMPNVINRVEWGIVLK